MMPPAISKRRFWILICVFLLLFVIAVFQIFQLMVISEDSLRRAGTKQHYLKIQIPPLRGTIFDRNGKEFATSLKVPSIYAVPRVIRTDRKKQLAQQLSKILDLDSTFLENRLARDKAFVWLKRKVSFDEAEKIQDLQDPGLGVLNEFRRFYPQGKSLAQVIGFTDIDNEGIEGLEMVLNGELQGKPGLRFTKRDALGREIKAFEMKAVPPVDGNRVFLTVDQYIQFMTERALNTAFTKWKAKGAAAVVMEAKTGKILAIVNRPSFDPNDYSASISDTRRNRAITDMYEPGSTFKIVAASAVLNEKKATLETKINCEKGEYRYGSKVLHDVHPYGELSFSEVLIKSSNIGTVKIAKLLEPEVFFSYIEKFGFNQKTEIDLPGEANGFIRAPAQWSKTSPYNIPMGHEVMVTLIQMARATAVIANGGYLVTPYIISRIEDQTGTVLKEKKPQATERIISGEVAQKMREIMIRVVEEGTGKNAKIDGIPVGGKTGTAQKVLPGGKGYSHSDFMSSFIGFAPGDDPQYVMAVLLDNPKPKYYGGTVAAPVFKEVMEAALLASGYVTKEIKPGGGKV